jgi:competence protein ComEA
MMKKLIMGFLVLSTSVLFGMSLSKLNSASKEDLMQINGIGEKKAAAIIKERKKGKFKSYDDLAERVGGIGTQTAANIKNDVKMGEKVKKVKKTAKKKVKKPGIKKETAKKKMTKSKSKEKKKKSDKK